MIWMCCSSSSDVSYKGKISWAWVSVRQTIDNHLFVFLKTTGELFFKVISSYSCLVKMTSFRFGILKSDQLGNRTNFKISAIMFTIFQGI